MKTPLKTPIVFGPVTERGTLTFDVDGDPVLFTRETRAKSAAASGEVIQAFKLIPVSCPRR